MIVQLQEELKVRAPQMRDIPAIAALVNHVSLATDGVPEVDPQRMRSQWQQPDWDHTTDAWLVQTSTGQFVGYGGVRVRPSYTRVYFWSYVHPEFSGLGIGPALVQRAEARAWEITQRSTKGPVFIEQAVSCADDATTTVLTQYGYQPVRRFWQMALDFTEAPPAPIWPDGITLRTLTPDMARAVYDSIVEAFLDHWRMDEPVTPEQHEANYGRWLDRLCADPDFDPSLVFVALAGSQVAGVAFNEMKAVANPDRGRIRSLSVCRPWRRQGIARALLAQSFGAFYRRGYAGVELGVDAASPTGAVQLYEKAGMRVTRQRDVYEKELTVVYATSALK